MIKVETINCTMRRYTLECVCFSQMCKFLVSLSKDFSSYYNRVHVLGVSSSCV